MPAAIRNSPHHLTTLRSLLLVLLLALELPVSVFAQERSNASRQRPIDRTADRATVDSTHDDARVRLSQQTAAESRQLVRIDTIDSHSTRLKVGRERLAAREFDDALAVFQAGLDTAQVNRDTTMQATYRFNLGLTLQTQAQAHTEPDRAALREAEGHYRQLIALKPASGAARNNLAQIYVQSGQFEAAAQQFEEAVALKDERQAFYALKYAEFLEQHGDRSAAIRHYELVRTEQPDHPEAHDGLVRLYAAHDPSRLVDYLWEIIGSGQEIRGTETAIALLLRTEWPADATRDVQRLKPVLLTQVAVGLSKQSYDPAAFDQMSEGRALAQLVDDEHVGPGAAALIRLHQMGSNPVGAVDPSPYSWWDTGSEFDHPNAGVWPREGFRMLVRSLGDRYRQRGETTAADAHYQLALNLSFSELDLQALLRLADLYFAAGQTGRLEVLINEYSVRLYGGKGTAYRRRLWKHIYEYHRALGTIYAMIERWGSSGEVASAIFQLEHARRAVREFNAAVGAAGDTLRFEPLQADLLARAYTATGEDLRAFRLRLEMAREYLSTGDAVAARRLLTPIDASSLPAGVSEEERAQFRSLRSAAG